MAKFGISFRVGRDKAGRNKKGQFDSSVKKSFDASNNQAITGIRENLLESSINRLGAITADAMYQRLSSTKAAAKIQKTIRASLFDYAKVAVNYFTNIVSQASRPVTLVVPQGGGVTRRNPSGFVRSGLNSGPSWEWPPLAKGTLERKQRARRPNKFFIETGRLRTELLSLLPGMFVKALSPVIEIEVPTTVDLKSRNRSDARIARFNVKLATGNLPGISQLPFMKGQYTGLSAVGVRTELLRAYMEQQLKTVNEDILIKLRNGGKSRSQRPWIDQTLSYWVLARLPNVLHDAISKALRDAAKGP